MKLPKNSKLSLNQAGFTIIELLISTLVFSGVLLIVTFGIIELTNNYINGSISSKVQNTNRSIVKQISANIQLNPVNTITVTPITSTNPYTYYFCVNGIRYIYQDNDGGGNCPAPLPPNAPGPNTDVEYLLGSNMQLIQPSNPDMVYSISAPNVTAGLYGITIDILYGPAGTYNSSSYVCNDILSGGAFCDNSTITTTTDVRIQ
jgi:prepilin-type N-terminal cleavage/methylation domain-containing protein